jgi:hypothetical protein
VFGEEAITINHCDTSDDILARLLLSPTQLPADNPSCSLVLGAMAETFFLLFIIKLRNYNNRKFQLLFLCEKKFAHTPTTALIYFILNIHKKWRERTESA